MENASKALIMVAGVLIAILLLTFMVVMFKNTAGDSSNIYDKLEESDITEFNQKFLRYENRNDLIIQDVVSIINIAKDNNENQNMPVEVIVTLDNVQVQNSTIDEVYSKMKSDNLSRYTCTIGEYDHKLVKKVVITTN